MAARVALQKFPLLNKPFKDPITQSNRADAQAAWQLWYEQVKSGKRTFRFEGDPTEYDLNGPASKDKLQRVERDRKRDDERSAGRKKSSSGSEATSQATDATKPLAIAGLIAACVLIAVAVGYFVRQQARQIPK